MSTRRCPGCQEPLLVGLGLKYHFCRGSDVKAIRERRKNAGRLGAESRWDQPHANLSEEAARALHARYLAGETLRDLGLSSGRSPEWIRRQFVGLGLERRASGGAERAWAVAPRARTKDAELAERAAERARAREERAPARRAARLERRKIVRETAEAAKLEPRKAYVEPPFRVAPHEHVWGWEPECVVCGERRASA